jgi:hypothetical protein
MISESEIIRRIRISDLGSANEWYADEIIEKYKIAAKTRLQYPTLTQKWTIDNQRQVLDVNDRTKIIGGRGSPFFDKIEFMIKTESELEQFLGGVYSTSRRQERSRKTFWERIDTSIEGNPKFSNYNKQIQEDEEKVLAEKLKEEQRQNELKRKQIEIVIPKTVISDKVVIPKTVIPEKAIVSSAAIIPLGILAFLLINSRNNKK